jgi:hypothetical protein
MRNISLVFLTVGSLSDRTLFPFSSSMLPSYVLSRFSAVGAASISLSAGFFRPNSLSCSLRLDSSPMFRGVRFGPEQHLSLEMVAAEFEQCQFIGVRMMLGDGGAILASVPVQLFNCRFADCWGHKGGAVSTNRSLSLHFVTFVSCSAGDGGAIDMRSAGRDSLELNLCLFLGNHAKYFGSFYRMTKGSTRLSSSNMTSSAASQCVGSAEAKFGSVDVRYTVLENSTAKAHNGGFCARLLESMRITRCLFARCRHTSDQQDAASALIVHNNACDSGLTDFQFVANAPDRSFTIVVATGHVFVVRGCLFSGPPAELRTDNLIPEMCLFAQNEFAPISFRSFARGRAPDTVPE